MTGGGDAAKREGESSTIPDELRGREVSARVLAPFFESARRRGLPLDTLATGTGYSLAHLENRRERIAWPALTRFLENVGRTMSDDDLVELGGKLLDSPLNRAFLVPGRLLFSLPDVYEWGSKPGGPLSQLLVAMDMVVTRVDGRRLVLETRMKPGYTNVREFWLLRLGLLRSVPRAFGLPSAEATFTSDEHGARYEVILPPDTGILSRIRERASWLFAARDAASALRAANDDLHARYLEVRREVEARKDAEEKLRVLNAELEARVEERTNALQASNRELAEANSDLLMFNAAVAHDLRAPLRSIDGFARALLEDYGDRLEAGARDHLGRTIGAAVRMNSLIEALFSLAQVGRAEMHRRRVDLAEVARTVLDDLEAAHPERAVEVSIGSDMEVGGDPALVRALMENLLGNAWKFSRDRRPARIDVARTARSPADVFRVRDNGAGFEMERAGALFAPFRRLHSANEFEGTGMGLAIVARIVRRHGGRIWCEAKPNEGAAFSFTLSPDVP